MGRMYSWLNRGIKETVKDYDNRINQIPKIHAGYAFFHPANYDDFRHVFSVYLVWNGEFNEKLVDAMPPGGYQLHCSVKEAELFLCHKACVPVFVEILSNQGKLLIKEIVLEYNNKCYPVSYNGCEVYSPEELCFWDIQDNEKGMFWEVEQLGENGNSSIENSSIGKFSLVNFSNGSFPVRSFSVGSFRSWTSNGSFRSGSFNKSSFWVGTFQKSSYRSGNYTASFGRGSFSLKSFLTGSFLNRFWQGSFLNGSFRGQLLFENSKNGSFRRGYGTGSFYTGSFRMVRIGQSGYLGSYRRTSVGFTGSYPGSFCYRNHFGNGSYSPLKSELVLKEQELDYLSFLEEDKIIQEIFGIGSLGYGLNLI